MDFSKVKSLIIPEGNVKQIVSSIDGIIWKTVENVVEPITNLLPLATDIDRNTIYGGDYNGDGVNDGYITGYRLSSSSGNPTSMAGMCCSGFIPAKSGDILRIKGITAKTGTASYVISYNSANTKVTHKGLGQTDSLEWTNDSNYPWQSYENGVLTVYLNSEYFGTNFDAIRFSAGIIDNNTIVTINQEITD